MGFPTGASMGENPFTQRHVALALLSTAVAVSALEPSLTYFPEMGGVQLPWLPELTAAPAGPAVDSLLRRNSPVMGTDTCGFVNGKPDNPWTCYHTDASCTTFNYGLGCCDTTLPCHQTFITQCYNYADVQSGSCSSANEQTLCCASSAPSCWGWRSTTNNIAVTAWNCLAQAGFGLLLPASEATDVVEPTTTLLSPSSTPSSPTAANSPTSASSPTSTSSATTPRSNPTTSSDPTVSTSTVAPVDGGSSTPIGAIVGGVLGGLAVIALVLLGVGILMWHRRHTRENAASVGPNGPGGAPALAQPPMGYSQVPTSAPHLSYYDPQVHGSPTPPPMAGGGFYDPSKNVPYSPSVAYTSGVPSTTSPTHWPPSASTSVYNPPYQAQFVTPELPGSEQRIGTQYNPAQLS